MKRMIPACVATKLKIRPYVFDIFIKLKANKIALVGLIIIICFILTATLAPLIAPHSPTEQHLSLKLSPPSWEYPLGTDNLGRCVLSRIIYGAQTSLQIAVVVVGITGLLGTTLGLLAGYFGGLLDEIIMRITDVVLAFPGLILALVVAGLLGPGLFNVMLALAIVGWTSYARVVRGCVLSAKEKTFVEAARALGDSEAHILLRHILPEVMAPVIVMATLGMGSTILSAAGLSFLGLGVQPPTPEWGAMMNSGRDFLEAAPHLIIFPGLAILFTVLSFNFLGDGLRDALDPRPKGNLDL
nr:ABC transporter permease [Dehalococcoides mccartyi]